MSTTRFVPLVLALTACGGNAEPSASPSSSAATTPATPVTTPTVPAAPPPAITRCTLGAPRVVVRDRGGAEVVVGSRAVAVVHRARRRTDREAGQCEAPRAAHVAPIALPADGFAALPVNPICFYNHEEETGYWYDGGTAHVDVAEDRGDLYASTCSNVLSVDNRSGEDSVSCSVAVLGPAPTSVPGASISTDATFVAGDVRIGTSFTRVGDAGFFAYAFGNTDPEGGEVFALVMKDGRATATERLGRAPSAIDLDDPDHFSMTATSAEGGGIVFEHGATRTPHRVRTTLDANGVRTVLPASVTVTPPGPPELATTTDRSDRSVPASVRLVRAGVPSAIVGLDPAVATFGSDFAQLQDRLVLVWSEGTGRTTKIRAAIVDTSQSAIVGPVVEVSTPGVEAGYGSVGVYDSNVVVAWDERVGDHWDIRAAPLSCR